MAPSALVYPSPQSFVIGSPISPLTPTVAGSVSQYSVAPTLPGGLLINPTSGHITGTPATAATTFALSLTVQPLLLLEPQSSTTIGAGQVIQGFVTLRNSTTDPYPTYLDPGLVSWSSAQPAIASINASGVIAGMNAGSTMVTAQYQSLSAQLEVRVRGALIARDIAVGGQGTRSYSIYVPVLEAGSGARAAILSLHGGGGSAMIQASTSQLNELADQQQIYRSMPPSQTG